MKYYNLTTPQQNIWNLQKYYEKTAISNLCGAVLYEGKRDSELLRQAISIFLQNQNGFHLRFHEGREPRQYVCEEPEDSISFMEFATMEEFEHYAECFAGVPLGLVECQLYRFVVVQVEEKSGILAVLSHLIADAWTFGLLGGELDRVYCRLVEELDNHSKEDMGMSAVTGDYVDFIRAEEEYRQSLRYEKDRSYWEEKYTQRPAGSSIKLCPFSTTSIEAKRMTRILPMSLEQRLATYCKGSRLTPAVLFETAVIIYLAKINSENNTITVGVPVLNRSNAREKCIAGMFVSTMPLTVEVRETMTALELAEQISREHMELFRHQKFPYGDILKTLREKQNFSGNLYEVMVSYQNAKTHSQGNTRWYSNGYSEIPLVLHIDNRDDNACHTLNVDYQTAVFQETEVDYLLARLMYILEQILERDCLPFKDISIVPPAEQKKIICDFNDTYVDYSRNRCVHELFSEQVNYTPERIALVFEEREFTYRQLEEMSNSLAHFLREKGVRPNDVVPIIAKRSWHVIVAILGVLKAGGAYLPVDPGYPIERIRSIIEESNAKIGLSYMFSGEVNIKIYNLEQIDYSRNVKAIANQNVGTDLCYVIYTSGSTGKPKGIMITHDNLYNYLTTVRKSYGIKNFNMPLITSIYVDLSVTATFLPLITGAFLEVIVKDSIMDELRYCMSKKYGVYKLTPTHIDIMYEMGLSIPYNSDFIVGGEAIKHTNIEYICKSGRLIDEYGPTEVTVGCSKKIYERNISNYRISIGRPISNTQIYILDSSNALLPIGVAGELCIAGEGVGKGYLNQPELTAGRFVPNPFATEENNHGNIMYRSGDLARWREDGEIEYLGRIDTQVKIRGLRIELGEIESVMSRFPGLALCAVTDKRDEAGRQYLVGYYTTEANKGEDWTYVSGASVNEKKLREYLIAKLPRYMVPNYFVHMESIPMTPSGKTDRKSLPTPDLTWQVKEYVAPVTEREKRLCRLLEELLQTEQVGVTDDFFESGGDSLTAIEYVAKAHDRGIDFALQNVFDYPTVQSLCAFLDGGTAERVHYQAGDFERYKKLLEQNVIDESFIPVPKELGNVFLTGATGFLGAHVLARLLQEEQGKIYCLVRSNKADDRRGRLREILHYYFGTLYDEEFGKRIIPVVGDIEQEGLGENLPEDVQTVIHTAASVKHYGSYNYFRRINVEGTRHVAAYAKAVGAELIHVSTLSVSGNAMSDESSFWGSPEKKCFDETSIYIDQPLDNVYVRSKFEAELVVYDAMLEGLRARVIRVGNLTNRASDYRFQPNYRENAFLKRIKAVLEFGLFPDYLMSLCAEFSPIDYTADGILKIARYANYQCVFHLNNNHPICIGRFLEMAGDLGIPMKVVEQETFYSALQQTLHKTDREYIYEAFQNDMDERGRLIYNSNIRIRNEFTVWFLEKVGFAWKEIDMEYLRGYVEYFRRIDYLKV